MKETFVGILENEQRNKVVPFLKGLSKEQKQELTPVIKKLAKEYLAFHNVVRGNTTYVSREATQKQQVILLLAAFVCFNRTEFERHDFSQYILERKILEEVIDWYCPDWFSDFVNALARQDFIISYLDYVYMQELVDRGHLHATPELIAKLLPHAIYENRGMKTYFSIKRLLIYPVTLKEHIWILFAFESNIYHVGRWQGDVAGKPKDDGYSGWIPVIKQFVKAGKLKRQRVLQESLYACNRNFNKLATGWFADLFNALEPTLPELRALQAALLALLGSPQSKAVNMALLHVKKLMTDKAFTLSGFLDHVPVLLSSSTKSIVAATLGILEKVPAAQPGDGLLIGRAVLQVFVQTDDGLQAKAAKIILSHKAAISQLPKGELAVFSGTMTASTRKLLKDLLEGEEAVVAVPAVSDDLLSAKPTVLTPIPAIDNIDDLVFLVSQALDNKHTWLIDVVPAALVVWVPMLQGATISRLEPALQRALKMMKSGINASQGRLDFMLAVFMIDVCIWLLRERGSDGEGLDKLFNAYKQEKNGKPAYWQSIGDTTYLGSWDLKDKNSIYRHYKELLLLSLAMIREEIEPLPLLCTPTHEPGWIAPEVLVNRLLIYQQADEWPDDTDMQVAVSRCRLKDTAGAIALAEQQLQGEYLHLCLFLFGKHPEPQGPYDHPTAWLAASVALPVKKEYAALKGFGYYAFPFSWYTGQRDWEVVKSVLKIEYLKEKKKAPVLLYDLFRFEHHYYGNEPNDFPRLLLLTPSNPEPLLALVARESLKYSKFWEKSANKAVVALLKGLHEIWDKPGNMAHVFVGACMLSEDKTTAGIAAEIWLKQAASDNINSMYLGTVIGLHERADYAPLKRFTDLVHQRLIRVSPQHNRLLQLLIEHVLQELPKEPLTNLKKLLEIYLEVLDINKSSIANDVLKRRLRVWERNAAVKKIVSQLITFSA